MTDIRRNRSSIRRPRIIDFSEFLRILYRHYSGEQATIDGLQRKVRRLAKIEGMLL